MNPTAETNVSEKAGNSTNESTRIVIVGGGPAAIEAMLALSELGGSRAAIDVFSPSGELKIRPLAVLSPFGEGDIRTFDMKRLTSESGAAFHQQGIRKVDTKLKRVFTADGRSYSYDYAVIATGTKSLWVVPGATTFWGSLEDEGVTEALDRLKDIDNGRLIFVIPPGATWPLPIYELALMTATSLAERGRPDLFIVSPETTPLEIFGERTSHQVNALLGRNGIEFLGNTNSRSFTASELITTETKLTADEAITLPSLTGRRLDGIPYTHDGFIEVGPNGEVESVEDVFAVGDVTDSKYKFGALATQQADVAAAAIARNAWGIQTSTTRPNVTLTGFLQTGEGPLRISPDGLSKVPESEVSSASERKIYGKLLNPFIEKHGN